MERHQRLLEKLREQTAEDALRWLNFHNNNGEIMSNWKASGVIGALGLYSQSAHAGFAVSVTGGSADYELEVIGNPGAENEFVDAIDDTFSYRDLGDQAILGNHKWA